jgi:hypothetical protein
MLGIGPAKDFQSWMNVFEKIACFKPKYIIPGGIQHIAIIF